MYAYLGSDYTRFRIHGTRFLGEIPYKRKIISEFFGYIGLYGIFP